jgi:hypothetical protein
VLELVEEEEVVLEREVPKVDREHLEDLQEEREEVVAPPPLAEEVQHPHAGTLAVQVELLLLSIRRIEYQ